MYAIELGVKGLPKGSFTTDQKATWQILVGDQYAGSCRFCLFDTKQEA